MASLSYAATGSNALRGLIPAIPGRTSVHEVFLRHREMLAGLPGETSRFEQSDFGYEWRCEFEIGALRLAPVQSGRSCPLQLHFSLVDIDRQPKPIAVLYLVDSEPEPTELHRLLLPLEYVTEAHEQLNEYLVRRGATIELFQNANRFIVALSRVRALLANQVAWA